MPDVKDYIEYLEQEGYDLSMVPKSLFSKISFLFQEETRQIQNLGNLPFDTSMSFFWGTRENMMNSMSNRLISKFAQAAEGNLNDYLLWVEAGLRSKLLALHRPENRPTAKTSAPIQMHPGVYPTYSLNAHAISKNSGYLVLIDIGTFRLIDELSSIIFAEISMDEKVDFTSTLVVNYCNSKLSNEYTDELLVKIPSEKNYFKEKVFLGVIHFVLAHEYGHCQRHIIHENESFNLLNKSTEIDIVYRNHQEEFEADIWALTALFDMIVEHNNSINETSDSDLILFCASIMMFFGFSVLVEKWYKTNNYALSDTHPTAGDRLYIAEAFFIAKEKLNSIGWLGGDYVNLYENVSLKLFNKGLEAPLFEPRLASILKNDLETLNTAFKPTSDMK